MKIKKVLIYLIFAFVMILPFSVNAENKYVETGVSLNISQDGITPITTKNITLIEEIIVQKFATTDFNYFITISPTNGNYRVYVNEGQYPLYFAPHFDWVDNTFQIFVYARNYFDINLETLNVSDLYYPSYTGSSNIVTYNFLSNVSGVSKGDKYYSIDKAKNELGLDFKNISTFNGLVLSNPILYANTEFKTLLNPTSKPDYYSGFSKYSSVDKPTSRFEDYPIFLDSNIPIAQGNYINLSQQTDILDSFIDFSAEQSTVSYSYNGKDNSVIEINIKIAEKPYKCTGDTLFLFKCTSKHQMDYLNFDILVNGNINSKIYFSKDGENFIKAGLNFTKTSSGYTLSKDSLGSYKNGYRNMKIVLTLSEEQNALFYITYNSKYLTVEMPIPSYDDSLYTEYDMTGKYGIGLIPKTNKLNASFKYNGNFITYFGFKDNPYAYEYDSLVSTDYVSKGIDFRPFIKKEKPIFYIINTKASDTESVAKIKYLSNFFELIYFEDYSSVVTYDGYTYVAPDSNITIKSLDEGGTPSTSSGIDLSLTSLVKKLPELISGLGNAFQAVGDCIVIAFTSLPEIVQSVLYISLIITIILIAIKLVK